MTGVNISIAVLAVVTSSGALAQGEQVRAVSEPAAIDGGVEPGGKTWSEVRPHAPEPKYETVKEATKKEEEKPKTGFRLQYGEYELEVYSAVQAWVTYTIGAQSSRDAMTPLESVGDRADFFIRRGRLAVRGKLGKRNTFNVVLAYDGIGKDTLNNAIRGGNNQTNLVTLFDAQWAFIAHPTWAIITLGWFRPQIGRESITSPFAVNSFEKAGTQNYMRRHIVGNTQAGRESGINIGGLYNGSGWGLNYNFGIFDTTHASLVGSLGKNWFPLLAARIAVTLGQPEMEKYGLSYMVNYFGKRTGITFAVQGTTQGRTDTFTSNNLIGFDVLANIAGLSVTAELQLMGRNRFGVQTLTRALHIRAGYTFEILGTHLEPTVMFFDAVGHGDLPTFRGRDQAIDFVLSWYVWQNNLKVNLVVSKNLSTPTSLDVTDRTDGTRFIRGDYIGLGTQFLY